MTESRALGIVAAVGVLLIGLVLLIGVGPLAGLAFLYIAVLCLILDRGSLFTQVDEARADADEAVRKTDTHGELIRALTNDLDALRDWCGLVRDRIEGDDIARLSVTDAAAMTSVAEARLPEYQADDTDLIDDEDTDCPECAVNGNAHRPTCSRYVGPDPTTQPIEAQPPTQPTAALITPQAITGDDDTWLTEWRAHLDNLANGHEEAK